MKRAIVYGRKAGENMRKRLVSIYIIGILIFNISGCAQTAEDTLVAEAGNVVAENTATESEKVTDTEYVQSESEKMAVSEKEYVQGEEEADPMSDTEEQAEPEPEKEIEYDGLNTYLSILEEYERAWEDESYTEEQWQKVDRLFCLWKDTKNYTSLCYSLSDLTEDSTEELIIGFLSQGVYTPYFIYAYDMDTSNITQVSVGGGDRVITLYENGIIESVFDTRVLYYDYYQLQKDSGICELLDEYSDNWFLAETAEEEYYKGDVEIKVTEEEFWNAINTYHSIPRIELTWHELDGFWEPEESADKAIVKDEREKDSGSKGYISAGTYFDLEGYINAEADSTGENYIDTEQVISDFLRMDSVEFQENYAKNELYQSGILYCGQEAWKTHIDYIEEFYYYTLEDITAIRFYKEQPVSIYQNMNICDRLEQYKGRIYVDYHMDYAVSIYSKPADDGISCIQEISFIKIASYSKTVPKNIYNFMERNYYQVLERLIGETWIVSPDGNKAACISNGGLPKYASQIYVWEKGNKPLTVFREEWQLGIVGWIDNDHLVYYKLHTSPPVLAHLERNEIEKITEERNYDTDGVKYSIQGSDLIAIDYYGEQIYQWHIQKKNGEIYIVEPD